MSLLVVGALHWDVVVKAPRLPELDETLRGQEVAYQFGGKGGNQAIAAANAGAPVNFAGRIGADAAGKSMLKQLETAGIDVSQLQRGLGSSGMSVAISTEGGDYGAVIVSAENHAFDMSEFKIPSDCSMVLLQNEMAPGAFAAFANAASATGAQIIWNAAPAKEIQMADLALVDTLIVNRLEAADLIGHDDIGFSPAATLAKLADLAPDAEIILTMGGDGAAFSAPGEPCEVQKAHPVDVISTHGAGDVFVGTYAASRLRGLSLSEAVSAGQKAASKHVSQRR
jgi:ribokinase